LISNGDYMGKRRQRMKDNENFLPSLFDSNDSITVQNKHIEINNTNVVCFNAALSKKKTLQEASERKVIVATILAHASKIDL